MREIKFRGFNRKNKKWVYGFYFQNRGKAFVCPDEWADGKSWDDYEVEQRTIGQFAAQVDSTEKEIYEGDIVRFDGEEYAVVFYEGAFALATKEQFKCLWDGVHPFMDDYKRLRNLCDFGNNGLATIIGNIYDL